MSTKKVEYKNYQNCKNSEISALLASCRLRMVYSENAYTVPATLGQRIIELQGISDINVENKLFDFCSKISEGTIKVPAEIGQVIKDNDKHIDFSSFGQIRGSNELFWNLLSYLFCSNITVYRYTEGNFKIRVYGRSDKNAIQLMLYKSSYYFLESLDDHHNNINQFYSKEQVTNQNKKPSKNESYNITGYDRASLANQNRRLHELSRANRPHQSDLKPQNIIGDYFQTSNNQFKDILINNDNNIKLSKFKECSNVSFMDSCVIENNKTDYNRNTRDVLNDCNYIGETGIHRKQVISKTTAVDSMDLSNQNKNDQQDQEKSQNDDNSAFAMALDFICNYQRDYQKIVVPYLENHKQLNSCTTKAGQTYEGKIQYYDKVKKFGFIIDDNGGRVLMHKDNVVRAKIDSDGLENCNRFFTILVRYKLVDYTKDSQPKVKATDIELINFVPKSKSSIKSL